MNIKKQLHGRAKEVGQEAIAIVFIFLGAFTLLSLLTYNSADPSLFTYTKRLSANYGGKLGAQYSALLIQFFGITSFLFSGVFFLVSLHLFRRGERAKLGLDLVFLFLAALSGGAFLSLHLGNFFYGGSKISSGGAVGDYFSKLGVNYLNPWGTTLFTLCSFLISLTFITPKTITFLGMLKKPFSKLLFFLKNLPLEEGTKNRWNLIWDKISTLKKQQVTSSEQTKKKPATPKENFTLDPLEEDVISVSEIKKNLPTKAKQLEIEFIPPEKPKKPAPKPVAPKTAPVREGQNYTLPSLSLLHEAPAIESQVDKTRLIENSRILETKLVDFGIEGQVVAVRPGPVITMYEFRPGPGVKISQISALADDLSLALSAQSVRIVAPIPGKSVVGIEIPNDEREKVFLREVISTDEFQSSTHGIPLAIGKDISGLPVVADLARMPHLLIAGAPGAGKSVFINSLICSLLYKFSPNDMRLIMVDPKQLELNLYEGIPQLLLPVVDDPKKASTALKWAVNEMERRYRIMAKIGVRNIAGYNQKHEKDGPTKLKELLCPEDEKGFPQTGSLAHLFDHDEKGKPVIDRMPFILVIIDEFADLMMVAPKDIETSVARLAQKARAAGIHLVIATQRPSVDVITGLIKANLPSRVSFQVSSKIDSRTILDSMGAEKLLGQGDMLFVPPGLSRLVRLHGAFINEDEIEKLCSHWKQQGSPVYKEEILHDESDDENEELNGAGDELYKEAIAIVREMGQASASMLQRRLKIGYNRAARLVETMEAQGIVGPPDGARPRDVLY